MLNLFKYPALFISFFSLFSCSEVDKNLPNFELTIENHVFSPEEIIIPANTKVNITIHNKDAQPEEFECPSIGKEKIISANSTANVLIMPLKAGVYEFYGEYNSSTAKGRLKVE
jgi:hypothetical protein